MYRFAFRVLAVLACVSASLSCQRAEPRPGRPPLPFPGARRAPAALYANGGFESGDLTGWTVETFLNPGVSYPTVNGTSVPPQSLADLGLAAGGVSNSGAAGPGAPGSRTPNGLSSTSTLRYPLFGSWAAVINGATDVSVIPRGSSYPTGANQNVNSIRQDMVVTSSDIDPADGYPHVRFVVAPVLQNPNHSTTEQPYYFIHVSNLTTGQDLFNRFNYVSQANVPWQNDSANTTQYLPWQAVNVYGPQLSVGDDVQVQIIASGCSLGGHWGEAYVDAFGAFFPGLALTATQPLYAAMGSNITTAYVVENGSASQQTGLVLTLPTPSNVTFASFTPPPGMTCSNIPAVGGTGTITCTLASLNPYAALSFNIVWKAKTGLTLPADAANGSYTVASNEQPTALLGAPAVTYLTDPAANRFADYSATIDDGVTSANAGAALTYTVTLRNTGVTVLTAARTPALVASTVNETNSTGGLLALSWTCTAAGTATVGGVTYRSACNAASGNGLLANARVSIVGGGSVTYVVKATAAKPTTGSYISHAISIATAFPAGYGDPDPTNDAGSDNDAFGAPVSITVAKDSSAAGTGRISSAPAGLDCGTACTTQTASFAAGVSVTLSAVADPGNTFGGWSSGPCAASMNPQCTFTPAAAVTASAKFLPPSFTITATASGNGTLSCTSPVYQGSSSTCTIAPGSGAALASLVDNGVNVTSSVSGGSYVIANVRAGHTVAATFLAANGGACGGAGACASGQCVDGVCCNTACGGACQACDVAGSVGTCAPVSGAPHGARPACASDGSSCGGSCNGTNVSACTYPTSQCRAGTCASGSATSAASCDGAGSCPAPVKTACNPYVCGASACKTSCGNDGDCVSGDFCNAGVCQPRLTNGGACTASTQCGSGQCVDGVCCNTACGGECQACDVAGSAGTCTAVTGAPHGLRPACASDGSSCGGSCNGSNVTACSFPTAQCRAASCTSGTATAPASCNGAGSCPALATTSCSPYVCGATACKTACGGDNDCIAGDFCLGGKCVPKLTPGSACVSSAQCGTGQCVDGVCCNTACGGECQACDVAGKAGTCTAVTGAPHGPRPACASDGSSCGGSCDGTNVAACAYPTAQCRAGSCANGTATSAASCDGAGSCPAQVQSACDPYVCGPAACKTSCGGDGDCVAGDFCSAGKCTPRKIDGTACGASNECQNAHCVDGFCCNAACNGQCQACDVPGRAGTCANVTGAPHGPRAACASDGSACGGSCDGSSASACAYPAGACRDASCAAGTATLAARCDGAGKCPPAQTQACNPYVCGPTACLGNCAKDQDCTAGDFCSGGVCKPKLVDGGACSASTQCANGSCADGVCCNRACDGQCEACNQAGSAGTCAPVTGAPRGGRAACATDGSACGGACDGKGGAACAYPAQSTSCRSASCADGTSTLAATCNGAGSCPTLQTQACDPYVCGAAACLGNCGKDGDCAAGNFCAAGVCTPKLPPGGSCGGASQCGSGFCVDGVCCDQACDGQCQACDVAGKIGTCAPATGAPHGARAACATDGTACGGSCDGTGVTACAFPTAACRGASCTAGTATLAASCDGAGHCPATQQQPCDPYACGASACLGNCATSADCKAGDYCSAGVCKPKLIGGGSCSTSAQCGSGQCVDGVCCDTACNGQCEACDVAGSVGTCSPSVGAPRGGRAACATDGSTCGGACDGRFRAACTFPAAQCRPESACLDNVHTVAVSCDGSGHCPATTQEACTCASDDQCSAARYCLNGACKPRGDHGDWVASGSGGCSQTGGALGLPLLALLGLFALRRRRAAAAGAVSVALAASAATAQGVSTSFNVDRFQPGAGSFDVLSVVSPETADNLDWHGSAYGDFARDPLRLVSTSSPGTVRLLRSQSMVHLGVSVGLGERFEIGAVLPLAVNQGSESGAFLGGPLSAPLATGGLGDLRILPKARLFRAGGLTAGVGLPVTLPTGRSDAFLSQGGLTAAPTALFEYQGDLPVRLVANAGVILRSSRQLVNLKVGAAFAYGAGAELPFHLRGEKLTAVSTLAGEVNAGPGANERPLELLGALKWTASRGLDLIAGGGPGLTNGYGTPRYRVFFSIAISDAVLHGRRAPSRSQLVVSALPSPRPPPPPEPAKPAPVLVAAVVVPPPPPPLPLPLPLPEDEEIPMLALAPLTPPPEKPKVLAVLDVKSEKIDLLAPVRFATNKDLLLKESRGVLDAAVQVLLGHPEVLRVRVEGHTDSQGKPAANKILSLRRAKAVIKYLEGHGIEAERLEPAGFGDERPIQPNSFEAGRARNRRVELVILERSIHG